MSKRLSEKEIERIFNLRDKGLSYNKISKKTKIPYQTVYIHIRAKEEVFESLTKYREHLIKKRGFESTNEYLKYLLKKRGFKSAYDYQKSLIKEDAKTLYQYRKELIEERGFKSPNEYLKYLLKERGFKSRREYKEYLATKKGFTSATEHGKNSEEKRKRRKKNRRLSQLIKKGLKETNMNQSQLAEQIRATRQAVSLYAQGKIIPKDKLLKKLFSALKLPYKTLDDLLE